MPSYSYICDACGGAHDDFHAMSAPHPERCPSCGTPFGAMFRQNFQGVGAIVVIRDSPTTFGQQAEINARRVGKEQLQLMSEQDGARTGTFTGRLPQGAKVNTTGTGARPWFRDGVAGLPVLDKPLDLKQVRDAKKYVETGETS